jgi:hypothetical protein
MTCLLFRIGIKSESIGKSDLDRVKIIIKPAHYNMNRCTVTCACAPVSMFEPLFSYTLIFAACSEI